MLENLPTLNGLLGRRQASPSQRLTLLRLIAVSAEQRIDLPALLDAWAAEEWRGMNRQAARLRHLARLLREETPLADAVERFPGMLSDEQVLLIRYGAQSGSLATTLRQELNKPLEGTPFDPTKLFGQIMVMLFVGLGVMSFVVIAIVPELEKIFSEFGLELPPSAQVMIGLGNHLDIFFLLLVILGTGLALTRISTWPGRFFRQRLASRFSRPVWRGRVGGVLERLGESVAIGRPLSGAISTLARYHYDPQLRSRLLFARNELELGTDLWPALTEAELLNPIELVALTAADVTGTRAWTLQALGETRQADAERGLRIRLSLFLPLFVILFGLFVGIVAVGMFSALISLINGLV